MNYYPEKRKIQKMSPSLLKSCILWDINKDIKNYDKNRGGVSKLTQTKCVIGYQIPY